MSRERRLPAPSSAAARQIVDRLWDSCRGRGLDRRAFLRLLAAGGAGSYLAACAGAADGPLAGGAATVPDNWFKDPSPFIVHGNRNLETRLSSLDSLMTPNELFFVRNNSPTLELDPADWSLVVGGDGVEHTVRLDYADLQAMPRRSVSCYLECGGNQRAMFEIVTGRAATGTQWMTGGVGMAEWSGVPLLEVLDRAGIRQTAVDVLLIGLDVESAERGFRKAISIDKAMDPDTILALEMNGVPLPLDHGYPLRAIVPGYVGSANIKWLGEIQVSNDKVWTRNNTTSYVLIGPDYPPEGESEGVPAVWQTIKSPLALDWPASLPVGSQTIRGYASSPHAPISRVEWSVDDAATWLDARLLDPGPRYSWVRYELDWDAPAGVGTIMTRATDAAGNTQPDEIPFNEKGYLFNLPLPHPVRVS